MLWFRAIVVWLVIMFVESAHGTLRTVYLEPWLGSFQARRLSIFTGCLLIFAITYIFIRWIGAATSLNLVAVGLLWIGMTLIFEFAVVGQVLGYSWERMTEDYDLRRGGLMFFGLLFMFLAPWLADKLRGSSVPNTRIA
jgi:hypothetical protein